MIKYSDHALEHMVVRGITRVQVEEAIKSGSKELQKPDKLLFLYRYFIVVARKIGSNYYIITVKPRW